MTMDECHMTDIEAMIKTELSPCGCAVSGGSELFMEVLDTSTGLYWMSAAAIEQEDFDRLEVDEPLLKFGCALASMDAAAFQSSPGAPDGSVMERIISGQKFINVAAVIESTPPTAPGSPMAALVNKEHVIGFRAGRSLAVMTLDGEDYVELVGSPDADSTLTLPSGAELRSIELTEPLVVHLPTPTRAYFWLDAGMRSFQGPVVLPAA